MQHPTLRTKPQLQQNATTVQRHAMRSKDQGQMMCEGKMHRIESAKNPGQAEPTYGNGGGFAGDCWNHKLKDALSVLGLYPSLPTAATDLLALPEPVRTQGRRTTVSADHWPAPNAGADRGAQARAE